jgi:transposase-like protein
VPRKKTTNRLPGRPEKYSQAIKEQICKFISMGVTNVMAAQAVGIAQTTFYDWMQKKQDFHDAVIQAQGMAVARWNGIIEKAAQEGNWTAAAWKLERLYPRLYGKQVHEITGGEKPVEIEIQWPE